MHARNRTWLLGSDPAERCRQRTMPVEGGDGSTLTLDFTTGVLDPRLTFTRNGGGTYIANDGLVYGMDFATSSSLAIGTGSKSVTLTATAGVDRRYLIGQTVWISNGANNMRGPVTAYNASTQVLTIDPTGTSGSGSFTSWTVGNASPRFDYDPTTLAPRGLLIEGSANNLCEQGQYCWGVGTTISWTRSAGINVNSVNGTSGANAVSRIDGPDGGSLTGTSIFKESGYNFVRLQYLEFAVQANTTYTWSAYVRAPIGGNPYIRLGAFNGGTWLATTGGCTLSSVTITNSAGFGSQFNGVPSGSWVRVWVTFTTQAAQTLATIGFYPDANTTNAATMYVWGSQVETGNGPSSVILTGASQGTRNQDQMQMTDLASLGFNTSAGTMTINGTYVKDANSAAFPRSIRFMGASVQSMAMITSGKTLYGNTPNTSGGLYFETSRTLASAGAFKFGWTLTTAANPALASATVSLNGSSTTIAALGQGAIVNPISLDFLYPSGSAPNFPSMNISSLKYWPYATTAADLNVRTSL